MGILDEDAFVAIAQVLESLSEIMNVVRFEDLEAERVLGITKQCGPTFYDASYLALAESSQQKNLTTDDGKLAKAARRLGVKTHSAGPGE